MKNKTLAIVAITLSSALAAKAQVAQGGTYKLEQSVIAGGGTSADAAGNAYKLDGVIGEPIAGTTSTGSTYAVKGGFLNSPSLAPTAAGVTVSGRVLTANGLGIRSVLVTLTTSDGTIRTVLSRTFGNFTFTGVTAGQTVILTAAAKRFVFSQPTQILSLMQDVSIVDFIALER